MDPNECLSLLIEALRKNKLDEVFAHTNDLRDWLLKGGFAPELQAEDAPYLLRCLLDMTVGYEMVLRQCKNAQAERKTAREGIARLHEVISQLARDHCGPKLRRPDAGENG